MWWSSGGLSDVSLILLIKITKLIYKDKSS
jgi:hypothetical protein